MEGLDEDLDLSVYDEIDEILCNNNYYGFVTKQEVQKHIKNKKDGKEDDGDFKMKSSNGFMVWCLTNFYIEDDVDYKKWIVDSSHDKGIDAVNVYYSNGTSVSTIYIYQAKYWRKRLGADVVTTFENILEMLKDPNSLKETNPTIYQELENRNVFEALKHNNTKILFVLCTTTELNSTANYQWDKTKKKIESDNTFKAKLELRDMHFLSKKYLCD